MIPAAVSSSSSAPSTFTLSTPSLTADIPIVTNPIDACLHVLSLKDRKITQGGVDVPLDVIRTELELAFAAQAGVTLTGTEKAILAQIYKDEINLTPNQMALYVTSENYSIPKGNERLLSYAYPRGEVLQGALYFIEQSTKHNWQQWFQTFSPNDSIYIADANTIYVSRNKIEKEIGYQLQYVPDMDYKIVGLSIEGNRIIIRSVNILKPKHKDPIYFLNDTILYYDGKNSDGTPKIRYNEDVIDKDAAESRVKKYMLVDAWNRGGALCNATKVFFKHLFE